MWPTGHSRKLQFLGGRPERKPSLWHVEDPNSARYRGTARFHEHVDCRDLEPVSTEPAFRPDQPGWHCEREAPVPGHRPWRCAGRGGCGLSALWGRASSDKAVWNLPTKRDPSGSFALRRGSAPPVGLASSLKDAKRGGVPPGSSPVSTRGGCPSACTRHWSAWTLSTPQSTTFQGIQRQSSDAGSRSRTWTGARQGAGGDSSAKGSRWSGCRHGFELNINAACQSREIG